MARHNDLMTGVRMGEMAVSLIASGTPYSPDVADDMARRTIDLWRGMLDVMEEYSMLDNGTDEADEEEGYEVPTRRGLETPHIVRFIDEWNGDEDG